MDLNQQIKEIKQSFRLMMDGMVAASMRNKGVDYKLNWGATLPRLKAKADEIGQNYDLAIALWKENVRECKILATMLMPADICHMPQRRLIRGWHPTRNCISFVVSISFRACS